MTNDKTVTMSRELVEDPLALAASNNTSDWSSSLCGALRSLLAAPVVERQPIAHRIEFTDGHKSKWIDGAPASIDIDDAREGVIAGIELAFASTPPPVAPIPTSKQDAALLIAGCIAPGRSEGPVNEVAKAILELIGAPVAVVCRHASKSQGALSQTSKSAPTTPASTRSRR